MDDVINLTEEKSLTITEMVTNVTDSLFQNNIKAMLNDTLYIIDKLQNLSELFEKEEVDIFNQIIEYIVIAMENKDYLFISDILSFELLPIIRNYNNGRENNDAI